MASHTVEKFMTSNNRPFSVNDVAQALKDLNKSVILKSLDQLVSKGVLRMKEYGKQKVYCAIQKETSSNEEFDDLDSQILQAQSELDQLRKDLSSTELKLKNSASSKSTADAIRENETFKEDIEELKLKLAALEKSQNTMTDDEIRSIRSKWDLSVKEYKKRKRMVTDILDQILEGYPKSKKHLIEEIGIEDDESIQMPKLV